MGLEKLWFQLDTAICKNLERFGKRWFFKMAMEKFRIFAWESCEISKNRYALVSY